MATNGTEAGGDGVSEGIVYRTPGDIDLARRWGKALISGDRTRLDSLEVPDTGRVIVQLCADLATAIENSTRPPSGTSHTASIRVCGAVRRHPYSPRVKRSGRRTTDER